MRQAVSRLRVMAAVLGAELQTPYAPVLAESKLVPADIDRAARKEEVGRR